MTRLIAPGEVESTLSGRGCLFVLIVLRNTSVSQHPARADFARIILTLTSSAAKGVSELPLACWTAPGTDEVHENPAKVFYP